MRAADPKAYLTYLATDDSSTMAAYAWQRSASWFAIQNGGWKVGIGDQASEQAAGYWQGLLDSGDITTTKRWDGFLQPARQGHLSLDDRGRVELGADLAERR